MNQQALQREIRAQLKARKAILLVHYYQRAEIQEIADILGDSLDLSLKAAETNAQVIVFAGVNFMAESAAIVSPMQPSRTQAITFEFGNSAATSGILLHHTRPVSNTTSVLVNPP